MPTVTQRFKCAHCNDGFQDEALLALHMANRHNGNGHLIPKRTGTALETARLGITSTNDLIALLVAAMGDRLEDKIDREQVKDVCALSTEISKLLEANYRNERLRQRIREKNGSESEED